MTKNYEDILHRPRPVSQKHPQMPLIDRAAQFAPFAALTGHSAAIEETQRQTDRRIDLDEYEKEILGNKLSFLEENLDQEYELIITYYRPDDKKDGGAYLEASGVIKKMDPYHRSLILTDGSQIPIDEIISIAGSPFD